MCSFKKIQERVIKRKMYLFKKIQRSGSAESKMLDLERAAFKPLENEDDFIDRPRISKLGMEERIRKLSKSLKGADIYIPEWKFSQTMRKCPDKILGLLHLEDSADFGHIYTASLDALGKARRPVEALNLFAL